MLKPDQSIKYLPSSIFIEPHYLTLPAQWVNHIPFISCVLEQQYSENLVYLGSNLDFSYISLCQCVAENNLNTKLWAIQTEAEDIEKNSGLSTAQAKLDEIHKIYYSKFSQILRKSSDEAVNFFENESIDILIIDSNDRYELIHQTFANWLPKLSKKSILLFHNTCSTNSNCGAFQLQAELQKKYLNINFSHGHGLGVFLVGEKQSEFLMGLCTPEEINYQKNAQILFSKLGSRLELRANLESFQDQKNILLKSEKDLKKMVKQKQATIESLQKDLTHARHEVQQIRTSRSWRVTAGLRAGGDLARKMKVGQALNLLHKAKNAMRYVARGDFAGLYQRIKQIQSEKKYSKLLARNIRSDQEFTFGITATPHTLFIAHLISNALNKINIKNQIVQEDVENFDLDLYIVICPQMFSKLPPREKTITFQMEQTVSSRWFTDEYIEKLKNSLATFEYAENNFSFLEEKGIAYPHVYFLPIGGFEGYASYLNKEKIPASLENNKEYDVFFYGDVNAPRRQKILDEVKKHFNVRVEGNLFGDELHNAMQSAHVVLNIHYYENALLETTRIYEVLSLGVPLVSETSTDIDNHKNLLESDAIHFTPIGDADSIIKAIDKAIDISKNKPEKLKIALNKIIEESSYKFSFMLYRALYALKILSHEEWQDSVKSLSKLEIPHPKIVLGLPETWRRRQHFLEHTAARLPDTTIFNGLRYSPGWMGCALSYRHIARHALLSNWQTVQISEDDVYLPTDYETRQSQINNWLYANPDEWDVFCGLIAIIHPETKILAIHYHQGMKIIIIDRMLSMVHNIYSKNALEHLASWDANNQDADKNTIDMHLQKNSKLRVAVCLPFLVGHEEDMNSSLWGFNNTQYSDMIEKSENTLEELSRKFSLTPD